MQVRLMSEAFYRHDALLNFGVEDAALRDLSIERVSALGRSQ